MTNHQELKTRWLSVVKYKQFQKRLNIELSRTTDRFVKKNRKAIEYAVFGGDYAGQLDRYRAFNAQNIYSDISRALISMAEKGNAISDTPLYDLAGITIGVAGLLLRGIAFRSVDFSHATIHPIIQSQFYNCVFLKNDLSESALGFYLENCSFNSVKLPSVRAATQAHYVNCTFEDCKCEGHVGAWEAIFENCKVVNCSFKRSGFARSRFINSGFTKCNFSKSHLSACSFDNTSFKECDFQHTEDGFLPPGIVE